MDFSVRGTPTPRVDRPWSGRPPSAKPQHSRNPITVSKRKARSSASWLAGEFLVSCQPAVTSAEVSCQPAGRRPKSLLPCQILEYYKIKKLSFNSFFYWKRHYVTLIPYHFLISCQPAVT